MTNSNQPVGRMESYDAPKNRMKNLAIGILAVALTVTAGYLIVDKNKNEKIIVQQEAAMSTEVAEKSSLQNSFDGSLARLDSMTGVNIALNSSLTEKNKEIDKDKAEIRSILNKKNATAAELSRAKRLIANLNSKITGMEQEVARLTKDNELLVQDKALLVQDKEKLTQDLTATTVIKDDLTKKVDIASTLNASNIAITPINMRRNGKESVTSTAKRVDKLVISFDVDNRIVQAGSTDVYVIITGPDGKAMSTDAASAGTFTTRENGDQAFTTKLPVEMETDKKKTIQFAFTPGANLKQGNYTVKIYQNGFMIGETTRELKKGGLFS